MDRLFRLLPVLVPVAVVVALTFPLLALGVRYDLWGFRLALPLLAGAALTAAILLAGAGVALLVALRRQLRSTSLRAIWVIVVLAVPMAMVFNYGLKASQAPVLYDVSTSWDNPPAISAARPEQANPLQTAADNRELQQEFYPDVEPVTLPLPVTEALAKVQVVGRELGWEIHNVDSEAAVVEATDTTFWFGFVDDITVRAKALPEGGTRIDVRSVSRVGKSDLGKNADRIRAFLSRIRL